MYISMNSFHVAKVSEDEFEAMWAVRDTSLLRVPGFIQFDLLWGREYNDHTLDASHTHWQSRGDIEA